MYRDVGMEEGVIWRIGGEGEREGGRERGRKKGGREEGRREGGRQGGRETGRKGGNRRKGCMREDLRCLMGLHRGKVHF